MKKHKKELDKLLKIQEEGGELTVKQLQRLDELYEKVYG